MISPRALLEVLRRWIANGMPAGKWILMGIIAFGFWYWMTLTEEARTLEMSITNNERGITIAEEDRNYKYSASGLKYFVECMEGRYFLITNPNGHSATAAGPINDEEC